MRIPFIAGNWKMFKTVHEAVVFVKELRSAGQGRRPTSRSSSRRRSPRCTRSPRRRATRNIGVAAQNLLLGARGRVHRRSISAAMIKEAGAEYVIIGHSERRRLFGETDATVNRKTHGGASRAGLTPIVCIGETLEERERDETLAVLDRQIKDGLDGLTADRSRELVIAYEPVWAIGTGRNATPAQAGEAHAHIRARLRQWFGADAAEQCHVIYGGSVKPDNIRELIAAARRRRRAGRRRQPRRPRASPTS